MTEMRILDYPKVLSIYAFLPFFCVNEGDCYLSIIERLGLTYTHKLERQIYKSWASTHTVVKEYL